MGKGRRGEQPMPALKDICLWGKNFLRRQGHIYIILLISLQKVIRQIQNYSVDLMRLCIDLYYFMKPVQLEFTI